MQFHLPKIIFDFGAIWRLKQELAWLGVKRPMLASDKGLKAAGAVDHVVKANPGVDFFVYADVPENPTAEGVDAAATAYRDNRCDGFVALGGGSVIDTAKAAAICVITGKPVAEYMGHPERINFVLAPLVTVPTTAGSGSEVSTGSGIHPTATTRAMGTASAMSIPRVAICDPELTLTLPPTADGSDRHRCALALHRGLSGENAFALHRRLRARRHEARVWECRARVQEWVGPGSAGRHADGGCGRRRGHPQGAWGRSTLLRAFLGTVAFIMELWSR